MDIGNTLFNPGRVLLGPGGGGPYIQNGKNTSSFMRKPTFPTPSFPGGGQVGTQPPTGTASGTGDQLTLGYLAPEAVRATGTGPFDAAYRQNLATYAGGQFQRPGGVLGFNPTGTDLFGAPTGGGTAPVPGMGTGLLESALGGQPFSFQQPAPTNTQTAPSDGNTVNSWQDWLNRYRQQGRMFGMNLE